MNRFGFLAENIRPLGSGKSNLFSDCMMTRDEKKAMFGAKHKLSAAQKAHQVNVKKVAELRKKGYSMAEAWKIVKGGKKSVPKKKTATKPRKTTSKTKPRKVKRAAPKRKPSSKTLTPAQKRAKRAMKLAHTKYKGKPDALKKAWKEVKKA